MRAAFRMFAVCLALATIASADPQPGRLISPFAVNDLGGTQHTRNDLSGRWTVLLVMTDKDTHPAISPWFRRVQEAAPHAHLVTMAALDLFPLVPTSTVLSEARANTPRARWGEVWLSRDGSLADALGLPESEIPWVIVVSPAGRVVEVVHSVVGDEALARVVAALPQRPAAAADASVIAR